MQTQRRLAPGATRYHEGMPGTVRSGRREAPATPSTDALAFKIFAAFRAHPHINNVLTHISQANWARVEQALNSILDLTTKSDSLSQLGQNIIDLMCADRGVTGRILKPYFHAALHRLLLPEVAERIIRHVEILFLELEWKAQQPKPAALAQSDPPSQEPRHAGSEPQ